MCADHSTAARDHALLVDRLAAATARLAACDESLVATQIAVSEIPAPTGDEVARGAFVANRFRALGLDDVRLDEVGNVLGTRPGTTLDGAIVMCAHLDTIFPDGTPVGVTRNGGHLAGPGI